MKNYEELGNATGVEEFQTLTDVTVHVQKSVAFFKRERDWNWNWIKVKLAQSFGIQSNLKTFK